MEAAMLFDDTTAIDGDHLTVGESLANQSEGDGIKVWLVIDRTEYSPVDNQEVSVSGRQPLALEKDGSGHGEFYQMIRLPIACAERLELFFHQFESGILFVGRVIAAHVQ
jgi:hypothetical protein